MPTDLSQLPPPPKGQTGVTLQSLSSLPPPPQGQTGMNLDQVQQQQTRVAPLKAMGFNPPLQPVNLADQLWGSLVSYGQGVKSAFAQGVGQTADAINEMNQPSSNPIGTGVSKGLKAESGVASAIASPIAPLFSPVSKGINAVGDFFGSMPAVQKFANSRAGQVTAGISEDLANAGNIAGTILGVDQVAKGVTKVPNYVQAAKESIVGTPEEQAAAQAQKQLQPNVDALNPDLTGKAKINAYKQVVKGEREVTPPSLFREQGLSADERTINLAKRLSDVPLGKDPLKNLDILGKTLEETETKLSAALKGDPEINFNADKPTLVSSLDSLKAGKPREFTAIKDAGKTYDNVIEFAKETVAKTEDSIEGIRDARTAFDSQARTEYPSAFKDGKIDTKTPAGRAIKVARDTINEHLYNTAPNGSEIQQLIGREADIFHATDNIAPKAASTHGKNIITKTKETIQKHPYVSGAAALYGLNEGKKIIGF